MRTRTAKTPRNAVTSSVATTTRRGCRASQAATRSIAARLYPSRRPDGERRDAVDRGIRPPCPRPGPSGPPPAGGADPTLPAAVKSLQRQTMRDWECVLVDDGSLDATGTLAAAVAADDPRFVVVSTLRRGLVAALSTGLARCRGE